MPVAVCLSYKPNEAFTVGLRIGPIGKNDVQYQDKEKLKQRYMFRIKICLLN